MKKKLRVLAVVMMVHSVALAQTSVLEQAAYRDVAPEDGTKTLTLAELDLQFSRPASPVVTSEDQKDFRTETFFFPQVSLSDGAVAALEEIGALPEKVCEVTFEEITNDQQGLLVTFHFKPQALEIRCHIGLTGDRRAVIFKFNDMHAIERLRSKALLRTVKADGAATAIKSQPCDCGLCMVAS